MHDTHVDDMQSIDSDNGLVPARVNQWWPIYWRIYASLGLTKLIFTEV